MFNVKSNGQRDVSAYCPQFHLLFWAGSCPALDSTAADHKSGDIYSSGLFWRGQRKAINLPACCPSMSQHNNSKRELNGNRCHILNWKYFHSWDKDTASSSRVICPLPSPHTDTHKHALKNACTISKSIVGLFWKTFLRFLSLAPMRRRDPSPPPCPGQTPWHFPLRCGQLLLVDWKPEENKEI